MQHRWHRGMLALCGLLLLLGAGDAAAVAPALSLLAAGRREDPPRHELRPGLPSPEQSSFRYISNRAAMQAKRMEAKAAEEAAAAAEGRRNAAAARLAASTNALAISEAAEVAETAKNAVTTDFGTLETVAEEANRLLRSIPERAEQAAARAVADVRAETLKKLQEEVGQVVAAAKWSQSGLAQRAADAGQKAAVPYQLAKMRAMQTMWLYVSRGRELATAVAQLKEKAVEIARVSQPLQEHGDPIHAQQLQLQSRDLMDKAQQLEAQAKTLQDAAAAINKQLSAYDDAAKAAAEYSAYQVNPSAIDPPAELPVPPYPLELPANTLDLLNSPVPAPAPAPAPGAPLAPAPAVP